MAAKIAARMNRMAPSGIRKVNEKALAMERAGEKVLHFEIGRPDFDTPEYIKRAANQALAEGKVHYTSNFGLMELRQAIADKLKRENNVDYKASEVLVTVGLSEAVFAVLAAILEEGDEILVPDPVWLNYINVPSLLEAKAVTYGLTEETGFQMDLEEVKAKITPKTRAIVIITPNNPTGGVLSEDVLKELAEIAASNDLMVISDEVYERLIYDGAKHISIASLPGMKERTFTMNVMSKITAIVMEFSPIGVCALLADSVGAYGLKIFGPLGKLILTVYASDVILVFLMYVPMVALMARFPIAQFFRGIWKVWVVTLSTTSSAGSLPVTTSVTNDDFGVSPELSSFSLPLGATINMNGGCIYYAAAIVMTAQIYGMELTPAAAAAKKINTYLEE